MRVAPRDGEQHANQGERMRPTTTPLPPALHRAAIANALERQVGQVPLEVGGEGRTHRG